MTTRIRTSHALAAGLIAATVLAGPVLAQGSGSFVTEQTQGQWRASKLVGVDVYGTDNVKIGDVKEILVDSSGAAQTAVIGVGGFLGIGEKNVAVPFKSVQWKDEAMAPTGAAGTNPPPARTDVGTTGTATPPAPAPRTAADSAARGYPDHGIVAMTKADLQSAPDFKYYTAPASSTATAPASGLSSPMSGPAPAPKP